MFGLIENPCAEVHMYDGPLISKIENAGKTSVDSQKGVQQCSVQNQKGALSIDFVQQ